MIKASGHNQAFHRTLVDGLAVDAATELKHIPIGAGQLTLLHNGVHGAVAHVFHAAHAHAHALYALFVGFHRELAIGKIDVRRQHGNLLFAAVLDIGSHLGGVAHHAVHHGGHELRRIIILEPARLHSDHGIAGGVRLVEGIAGKGCHFVKDMLGHGGRHAAVDRAGHMLFFRAVDKVFPLGGHDVLFLFGHGAAHQIASAHGIARQIAHDLHHLLLIHHAAISNVQNGRKLRRFIVHTGGIALARNIARNGLHGAGTVQADGSDDILKVFGLHVGKEGAHAAAFQLEHAVRIALGDHLINRRIVHGDVLRLHIHTLRAHQIQRIPDHRQGSQAQEVHFKQAQLADNAHGELRGDNILIGLQRHKVHRRFAGNEHAGGMGRGMARHALQFK